MLDFGLIRLDVFVNRDESDTAIMSNLNVICLSCI